VSFEMIIGVLEMVSFDNGRTILRIDILEILLY
jgi:hypothetical protein